MEHYMIIRLKDGTKAKQMREEMTAVLQEALRIEGIKKVDVFLSSYHLKDRYDMMIRIKMKKASLPEFESSQVYKNWKERFEDEIESMTVFDS